VFDKAQPGISSSSIVEPAADVAAAAAFNVTGKNLRRILGTTAVAGASVLCVKRLDGRQPPGRASKRLHSGGNGIVTAGPCNRVRLFRPAQFDSDSIFGERRCDVRPRLELSGREAGRRPVLRANGGHRAHVPVRRDVDVTRHGDATFYHPKSPDI